MSTTPPAPHSSHVHLPSDEKQIVIVSHSNLFYWWPVWAVGFLLAFLSWIDGSWLAIVPTGTKLYHDASVEATYGDKKINLKQVDVLVPPEKKSFAKQGRDGEEITPIHMAMNKTYGVVFVLVLLLVILITNVPLRGLWSFVVLIIVIFLSIIFAIMDWWEPILERLGRLHIHMNLAGYFLFSLGLFIIWAVTFFLFDRQIYMIFTPGQLRVCQEIGGGLSAHDTAGMVVQKQRNDLFRHWILGLGSGDLIVSTSGAQAAHYDLPNVLFIGYKVRQIENMLREKAVVQGQ